MLLASFGMIIGLLHCMFVFGPNDNNFSILYIDIWPFVQSRVDFLEYIVTMNEFIHSLLSLDQPFLSLFP